jgi:hypothetical protein
VPSPDAAVAALAGARGAPLWLVEPLAGGEIGTHEVRWADGEREVLKTFAALEHRAAARTSVALLATPRSRVPGAGSRCRR